MRYESTSAFTSTAGAASYLQIKGSSIYRPWTGNTDSCGGYQRMYTQYLYSCVLSSKITVRVWGGVSGQDEPFRIIVLPCTNTAYTTYSAYANIASLIDVPHARQALFSPGGVLPTLKSFGTPAAICAGEGKLSETEMTISRSSTNGFSGSSGVDPGDQFYYLVGMQNMAGTTTTNQQLQITIEYVVKWYQPVATAVQSLTQRNKWGGEEVPPGKPIAAQGSDAKRQETKTAVSASSVKYGLLFGDEPDPESTDPEEVLFRKMLSSRLGTVPIAKETLRVGAGTRA